MTALSIIIVSYNTRDDLARCLESLRDHPPAAGAEIVVVDNASVDRSAEMARQFGALTIVLPENVGFAAANNAGIRASHGERILLLNSDTVVPGGAIDVLIEELDGRPGVGAIGPRLVDGDGHAELSFGSMLSPVTEWRRQRLMRALTRRAPAAVAHVEALTRRQQSPDWISGACLLVRRSDALAAGLLDERFFLYTEDIDFCAAIRALGKQILFTPRAEVVHLRGRSGASDPERTRAAYRRSHIAFYDKHHPRLAALVRAYHWVRG